MSKGLVTDFGLAFTLTAGALSITAISATNIPVEVGLGFYPTNVTAAFGDVIVFSFILRNHWLATQSTFDKSCTPLTCRNVSSGFCSNFDLDWSYIVANISAPLVFYCQQTVPTNHCHDEGMVFVINPTSSQLLGVFQKAAKASGSNSSSSLATKEHQHLLIGVIIGGDLNAGQTCQWLAFLSLGSFNPTFPSSLGLRSVHAVMGSVSGGQVVADRVNTAPVDTRELLRELNMLRRELASVREAVAVDTTPPPTYYRGSENGD
ncbi:hypothetical protein BDQ17DRAFT_1333439 [Cyathus striatus]|nr:hypothetical protein BDQ17DRAFT_1333439 [Cyathus striatus]